MKVREYKQVTITNKGEKSILNNHPWVYAGEVVSAPIINNGEIVDVINLKGKYLGSGYYNANSKIIIRLISRNANDKFDYDFYKRRVRYAWDYRKNVMPNDLNCVRVIFGEADFFPGTAKGEGGNRRECLLGVFRFQSVRGEFRNILFGMMKPMNRIYYGKEIKCIITNLRNLYFFILLL